MTYRHFTFLLVVALAIYSCTPARETNTTESEEERFIQSLSHAASASEKKANAQTYERLRKKHLTTINALQTVGNSDRYKTLIAAYTQLQQLYTAVQQSACCSNTINATSFATEAEQARADGAAYYYQLAEAFSKDTTPVAIRKAYRAFADALHCQPDYRDAMQRKEQLYNDNVFIVALNQVEDSTYFSDRNLHSRLFSYVNNLFIEDIIREIDTAHSNIPFLRVMKATECIKNNLSPDWVITVELIECTAKANIETNSRFREVEPLEIGRDSSGNPITRPTAVYDYTAAEKVTEARLIAQMTITGGHFDSTVMNRIFEKSYDRSKQGDWKLADGSQFGIATAFPVREAVIRELLETLHKEYKTVIRKVFDLQKG
jgi:hypothetical protein